MTLPAIDRPIMEQAARAVAEYNADPERRDFREWLWEVVAMLEWAGVVALLFALWLWRG